MVREIFSHSSAGNLGRLVVSCSEIAYGQAPFRGAWRGSGSVGSSGLFGLSGSEHEINKINQIDQTNQLDCL
jgi:hypothetical protein